MNTKPIEFDKSYRFAWIMTILFFWTLIMPIVAFALVKVEHYYFDGTRLIKIRGSLEVSLPVGSIGRVQAHKRGFKAWSKDGGFIQFAHIKDGRKVNELVKQTQTGLGSR